MFTNTFQKGFVSIFYSVGSSPLQLWDKQVKNGHIRRLVDEEVKSLVLEISGTNVATTYITCPIKPRLSLGIRLPFLVMIIKNMKKYFTFEIQILDDKDMHRRFRVSNFQSTTKVRPFCTTMPIGLSSGWNQVQFNLADFTKRAYGSTYIETTRVQIHANVRIRRIYFSDVLYSDEELPNEYKLFVPTPGTQTSKGQQQQQQQKKKTPISKTAEKKVPKKISAEEMKVQMSEKEIPSGAPPSPAGAEEPRKEVAPPTQPLADISEVAEPPSEEAEMPTSTEPTSAELTEATSTAGPSEQGEEGEVFVDASETPSTEAPMEKPPTEVPKVAPPAEAPPAQAGTSEEAKTAEAPPADKAQPAEAAAPDEKLPVEETKPAEEQPPKEKPAEEKPAEEKPAKEKPAEEKAVEEKPAEKKPPTEEAVAETPAE